MNDQGLFVDANGLAATGWQEDPGKPKLPGSILDYILAYCATVDEVVELFRRTILASSPTLSILWPMPEVMPSS